MEDIWHTMSACEKLNVLMPYRDEAGRNVLACAARTGDKTLIKKLLASQIPLLNYNTRDLYGNTALHHAVLCKQEAIVIMLLSSIYIDSTIANQGGATAYEIITAMTPRWFTDDVCMLCYARMTIDYAITRNNDLLKRDTQSSKSGRTLENHLEYITSRLQIMWAATEYASHEMPLEQLGGSSFLYNLMTYHHRDLLTEDKK